MSYKVRIYDAKLQLETMRFVDRRMRRIIDDIHNVAVRGATGGRYSKGALAESIYKRVTPPLAYHQQGEVGSNLPYAASVERGAAIHNIFPKAGPKTLVFGRVTRFGNRVQFGIGTGRRRFLRFYWRGSYIITPHVPMSPKTIGLSHPGQRGKHFLLKALIRAAAKYNMKISIYEI